MLQQHFKPNALELILFKKKITRSKLPTPTVNLIVLNQMNFSILPELIRFVRFIMLHVCKCENE